jgi:hypothetical protein
MKKRKQQEENLTNLLNDSFKKRMQKVAAQKNVRKMIEEGLKSAIVQQSQNKDELIRFSK